MFQGLKRERQESEIPSYASAIQSHNGSHLSQILTSFPVYDEVIERLYADQR